MDDIKSVLNKFNPVTDKYVSREFQTFALKLAEELDDYEHRAIYMRLAKTVHRSILEQALSFVVDSNAKNKGGLFMWKLKELRSSAKKRGTEHETTQKTR
ncbi:MAG TPA: hypothetical protein VLG67_00230 [Candidatus Saccharimonadales bacterium]|nr:hypothetical protein [Candidatus Saccharimonadales bacterium]